MPEVTKYEPGTPSWVDLGTSDPESAREFYSQVFGWEYEIGGEETGFYANCLVNGKRVAGLGGKMDPNMPTVWTTYIATDDADATMRRVAEAGGKTIVEPMDIAPYGRMAVASDVTGAVFGLWQAGEHYGAQLANEPGAFTWNEVTTRDLAAAKEFYTHVFGYTWETVDTGEGGPPYEMFKVDDRVVGGAMQMTDEWPSEIPPFWGLYFAVADTDATIAAAERAGGAVQQPAMDTPFGRMAVLRDPQGGVFSINQAPPDQQNQQ